jgi:hypothetical protein
VGIHLDDPQEGKAALQRLLRLAASNIGSHQATEEELTRVVGELRDDPTGERLAWFAYVASAVAVTAAWRFARDGVEEGEEPTHDDAVEAMHSVELAVEAQLGGLDL